MEQNTRGLRLTIPTILFGWWSRLHNAKATKGMAPGSQAEFSRVTLLLELC